MSARIDHAVTSGTFSLDGGTWDVDNNVWVVGDDQQCVVIDAPHEAAPIIELIGDRTLLAVLCTHAHDDHVTVTRELAEKYGAPIYLHPDEQVLWDMTHEGEPFHPLADGQRIPVAGIDLEVIHTPGHSPGAVCFRTSDLGAVFSGDTLFNGGPGATGRSHSSYDTIVASILERLFGLPADTVVHTGHGDDTTIGAEKQGAMNWQRPE